MSQSAPLLVDTDDRRADPLGAMFTTWGEAVADRSPAERKTLAASRLGYLDGVLSDLNSGDGRRSSRAMRVLFLNSLTSMTLLPAMNWLQRMAETGEVPA